jgi:hypothetical protein
VVEARDWCKTNHPGSPITEIGPGGKRWQPRKRQSDLAGEGEERSARPDLGAQERSERDRTSGPS